MKKEKMIPFNWEGWDELDILVNNYYDVVFYEDFGEFKKDEKFSSICVNFKDGIMEAYNDDGTKVIKKQNFICTPIN